LTFLNGSRWRDWNGRIAVASMAAGSLSILTLDANGMVTGSTGAPLPSTRMRSLVIGPDGNLYIATDSGEIWQVVPN
jgi:glucose/arabinose dehydrogenase